jgi:putative ABC transport system permease protein
VAVIDNVTIRADLSGGVGEPERVGLAIVTEDYFSVMGAPSLLGRTFEPDDFATPGPARGLVISYGLWQRRYAGDPQVIGQDIYLNGRPYPVVGVARPNSLWPSDRDVIVPLAVGPNPGPDLLRRDNRIFIALARLKAGSALEQVDAALATLSQRMEDDHPEVSQGWTNRAAPLLEYTVGSQLRTSLVALLAAVGFVLLITCVNVTNLLLARAATREREMAIRIALGAGRLRLIRQLLTESLVLALAGGGLGFLLSLWGVELLTSLAPADTPRLAEVEINAGVLGFTLSITLLTALVCGLIPAWQTAKTDFNQAIKESGRTDSGGLRGRRLRDVLIVAEVALSLTLLIGAGLMIRSFVVVQSIDPGLQVEGLVTMRTNAPSVRYPEQANVIAFYRDLVERIKSAPEVVEASYSSALPLGGGGMYLGRSFLVEGRPEPPAGNEFPGMWNVVSPGYFRTSGIRFIKGRDFDERDSEEANPVIIINEAFARRAFGDEDPLGKRIRSWRDENQLREIVGVVADVRYDGLEEGLSELVYVPHRQNSWRSMALNVRIRGDMAAAIGSVRSRIKEVDKDLVVANVRSMTYVLDQSTARRRLSTLLLTAFGVIAGALAALGIYGVLSHVVAQRSREIGVRMALGARRADVFRMIVGHGMKLAVGGMVIGLAGAFALTRLMTSLLYEVSAADPLTFLAIAVLLSCVALAACLIPARRATNVDPMVSLRTE